MFTAIIVDDHSTFIEALQYLCNKTNQITVLQSFTSPIAALSYANSNPIDLIFLDMEMPELSGLEFLKKHQSNASVIITSAKKEYAFYAYEYNVVDYLHKPIPFPRFQKAIEKLAQLKPKIDNSIFITVNKAQVKLIPSDIVFVETMDDYLTIHTLNKKHIIHSTLSAFYKLLSKDVFIKCHQSYIVNKLHVISFDGSQLAVHNHSIPVSRSRKKEVGLLFK